MNKEKVRIRALLRYFLILVFAVYVFIGVSVAIAMNQAVPALNGFGLLYVGATWPLSAAGINVVPEPGAFAELMFTFEFE